MVVRTFVEAVCVLLVLVAILFADDISGKILEDMMADEADIASESAERELERLINDRPRFEGTSALQCVECGADIPVERREQIAGVQLCVECQTVNEAQARHYRF